MAGQADDDTVWGDGGNDTIDGGGGNDNLFGGDGNDVLTQREFKHRHRVPWRCRQ